MHSCPRQRPLSHSAWVILQADERWLCFTLRRPARIARQRASAAAAAAAAAVAAAPLTVLPSLRFPVSFHFHE